VGSMPALQKHYHQKIYYYWLFCNCK
jgi:hypothetical protein